MGYYHSYRGRHERDYVSIDSGWDLERCGAYYTLYEEANPHGKGSFFVVELTYTKTYIVGWRPNRNCTTEFHTHAMTTKELVDGRNRSKVVGYDSYDDAVASISEWARTFVIPEHYTNKKNRRIRDSQKSRVYRWEHKMARDIGPKINVDLGIPATKLNSIQRDQLEQRCTNRFLLDFLAKICQDLDQEAPNLRFRKSGRCSYGGYDIRLLPEHCNRLILMHEFSHVLHRRWSKNHDKEQSHGKEFVGIYAYLLIRFGGVDQDKLVEHMLEHNIKFEFPKQFGEWILANNTRKAA